MTLIFVTLWIYLHCPLSPISYLLSQTVPQSKCLLISENMPCSSFWVWVSLLWINFSSSKFHDTLLKSGVLWYYVNLTYFCLLFGWGISRLLLDSGRYVVYYKEHSWANVLVAQCRIFWCNSGEVWLPIEVLMNKVTVKVCHEWRSFLQILTNINWHFCIWS